MFQTVFVLCLLQFFVLSLYLTPETEHKSVVKALNLGRWQTMFGDQQTSTGLDADIIIRVLYLMNFDRPEPDPFQIIPVCMCSKLIIHVFYPALIKLIFLAHYYRSRQRWQKRQHILFVLSEKKLLHTKSSDSLTTQATC